MLQFHNIVVEITNFLIPFLIGSLIFFSLVIAPNIFVSLDQQNARKFIRSIFPKLYLWGFLISLTVTFLIISHGTIYTIIFLVISSGFLFSRLFLVKWINAVSDIKKKNRKQQKKFRILHSLSVFIFVFQIICMAMVYFKIQ